MTDNLLSELTGAGIESCEYRVRDHCHVRVVTDALRKCSGARPCSACAKADTDCRYEEIQKKKPRHVLMEERVRTCHVQSRLADSTSLILCSGT